MWIGRWVGIFDKGTYYSCWSFSWWLGPFLFLWLLPPPCSFCAACLSYPWSYYHSNTQITFARLWNWMCACGSVCVFVCDIDTSNDSFSSQGVPLATIYRTVSNFWWFFCFPNVRHICFRPWCTDKTLFSWIVYFADVVRGGEWMGQGHTHELRKLFYYGAVAVRCIIPATMMATHSSRTQRILNSTWTCTHTRTQQQRWTRNSIITLYAMFLDV